MQITKSKVIALMEEVVAEQAADKQAVNRYTFDGKTPVCLVAHVFYKIYPASMSRILSTGQNYAGPRTLVSSGLFEGVATFTEPAIRALNVAQDVQDGRYDGETDHSWGNALEVAKRAK